MIFKVSIKTPVLDCIKYTGDNLKEVIEFTGKNPKFDEWFKSWEEYQDYVNRDGGVFKMFNSSLNCQEVQIGDYIIRDGGFCGACTEDQLKELYEIH